MATRRSEPTDTTDTTEAGRTFVVAFSGVGRWRQGETVTEAEFAAIEGCDVDALVAVGAVEEIVAPTEGEGETGGEGEA